MVNLESAFNPSQPGRKGNLMQLYIVIKARAEACPDGDSFPGRRGWVACGDGMPPQS
jgi:hypothetical protein